MESTTSSKTAYFLVVSLGFHHKENDEMSRVETSASERPNIIFILADDLGKAVIKILVNP